MANVYVQIYTMQSVEEALAVAALGIDHVGVTPSQRGLPGEIDSRLAADICEAMGGHATSVALSVESDPERIVAMVGRVKPDIVHLCGPPGALSPCDVAQLKRRLPSTPVMQAIAITGPEAIAQAIAYSAVTDYLILDSVDPRIAGIGAAGTVHDWAVSAEIVATVDVPVILAGGLSSTNVGRAIEVVRPWGVDSLTHTNRRIGETSFRKDFDLIRQFVAQARDVL